MTAPRRIMHADFDTFFVSVERLDKPELCSKPVIVGGRSDQRGVVSSASYEARKFGVRAGMPISRAKRLCPKGTFIEGSFKKYLDYSMKLMFILGEFSPFIEPVGIDEAFLDVTGFESLHGSIHNMAQEIRVCVKKELGLDVSIGIGGSKVTAKVASKNAKPNGLLEVPAGEDALFLAPMPVSKLPGIGDKTEKRLFSLGIKTLGQLAATPEQTLKAYFGVYGRLLKEHAQGISTSKVELPPEAKSISKETTFMEDTRDIKFLRSMLSYMSEKVGKRLREYGKYAKCITLKVKYQDFTSATRRKTLPHAIDSDEDIFSAGWELLERELHMQKMLVRLLGIGVSYLSEGGTQMGLLDGSGLRKKRLSAAMDKIRHKYGFRAIYTGKTIEMKEIYEEE